MRDAQFQIDRPCPKVDESWVNGLPFPICVWVDLQCPIKLICGHQGFGILPHRGAVSTSGERWDYVVCVDETGRDDPAGIPAVCEHMGHLVE